MSDFYTLSDRIYLDGNSLGLLSRPAEAAVLRVLAAWREHAVEGWTAGEEPWFHLAERLAARMAPLVGAAAESVIVANSTTVNLHQLLATLYRPEGRRTRILVDDLAFPSDAYAVHSFLASRGRDPAEHVVRVPSPDGRTLREEDLLAAADEHVALAVLPSVVYTSGQLLDVAGVTRGLRERGVLAGWDLSHSAGVVPHALDDWGVDFAFWCGYKYLNGGPGAAGALYLNRRHFGKPAGLAGWWGSDKARQFDMGPELAPAAGAWALQIGTPPILSMAPLLGSLEAIEAAGIERLRERSLVLTRALIDLADAELVPRGFTVVTPREDARRGGHVALAHPEAARVCRALRAAGVIPDFRPPDLVRLAPVPLYNTHEEIREAVRILTEIVDNGRHREVSLGREEVP